MKNTILVRAGSLACGSPVTVMELVTLKPGTTECQALTAGQEYDDALDANAHSAAGYIDHAHFFYSSGEEGAPPLLIVMYPWADIPSLSALIISEDSLLNPWIEKWANGPRTVRVLSELQVEVE